MAKHVEAFVASCDVCARVKPATHKPNGTLQSVDPPVGRWTDIATDLITGLPAVTSRGVTYDAILTVVDKLSNRAHFYPMSQTMSTDDFATLFLERYVPQHGVPHSIQSDRGPQFTSEDFSALLKHLGRTQKMGVAYHQQSNGRVENHNKTIEQYLRLFISENADWYHLLPLGEFAIEVRGTIHNRTEGLTGQLLRGSTGLPR